VASPRTDTPIPERSNRLDRRELPHSKTTSIVNLAPTSNQLPQPRDLDAATNLMNDPG
jgi:hypothetical protein